MTKSVDSPRWKDVVIAVLIVALVSYLDKYYFNFQVWLTSILIIIYPIYRNRKLIVNSITKTNSGNWGLRIASVYGLMFVISLFFEAPSDAKIHVISRWGAIQLSMLAISEEIVFSGYFLQKLLSLFNVKLVDQLLEENNFHDFALHFFLFLPISLIIVAIIFPLVHVKDWGKGLFWNRFLMSSLAFGFTYYLSGRNIVIPSVIHTINNLLSPWG